MGKRKQTIFKKRWFDITSWDNVRSTAAPYTESRLTRSVANERVGFPVVEHRGCKDVKYQRGADVQKCMMK